MRTWLVVAAALLAAGCSASGDGDAVEWAIPVPAGTQVFRYEAVPPAQRTGRVRVVGDVRIGAGHEDDERYQLFRPEPGELDRDGRLYVAEIREQRVRVFDRDGEYLRALGRAGDGPGELRAPTAVAVAGDRVFVADMAHRRLEVWTSDGALMEPVRIERMPLGLTGLDDGRLIGWRYAREAGTPVSGRGTQEVILYEPASGTEDTILRLPADPPPTITRGNEIAELRVPHPRTTLAVSRSGRLYVTRSRDYQVFAFDPDGEMAWALAVPWPRGTISDRDVDRELDRLRQDRRFADASRDDLSLPMPEPAILFMKVDGDGRLYVVPMIDLEATPDCLPVDVYSPDGTRVAATCLEGHLWQAANGSTVTYLDYDPASAEFHPVLGHLESDFDTPSILR